MPPKTADSFIPPDIADKLIAAHDGDVALLYIYLGRSGGRDLERAAKDLCRTAREMEAAAEKLERLELSKAAAERAPLPLPEERLPEYTSDEIVRRTSGDGSFAGLVGEAERVLGHVLGGADLKQLFGLYDHLALPPEVIMELMNYCADLARQKGREGAAARTSMRRIVTEGYNWANNEILTLELAEDYIRAQRERRGGVERLRSLLGIADRRMTKTEEAYLGEWLAMGFGEDAVNLAYERTVERTGGLTWRYMDKILKSWHSMGLHTVADIEAGDLPRPSAPPASGDFSRLAKTIEKV